MNVRLVAIRTLKIYAVFLAILGAALGGYVGMHRERLLPSADSVIVYGRDACGITTAMRSYLQSEGVPFHYANVDDGFWVNQEMWYVHEKVKGRDPTRARFPIVRVGNLVLERPENLLVLAHYRASAARAAE